MVERNLHHPKKLINIYKTKKNSKNKNSHKNSDTSNYLPKHKRKAHMMLKMLHVNAADMKNKAEDLKNKIKFLGSLIVSVQETHYKTKGRFKLDNFVAFEAVRKNKEKGGTMLLIHSDLKPILIKEYNETFELVVVEINTPNNPIRVSDHRLWTTRELD